MQMYVSFPDWLGGIWGRVRYKMDSHRLVLVSQQQF